MKKLLVLVLMLALALSLCACTATDANGETVDTTASTIMTLVMLLAVVAIFYFMIIRPQKKQEKETQAMLNSLEVGDTISTVGGIIGIIIKIRDDMLLIETGADRTKIQIAKWAVRKIEEKGHE